MQTAGDILELVGRALGDPFRYEMWGGDAVGTDAYPELRDAHPTLVNLVGSEVAEVRMAAAYALAFLVERSERIQPVLDEAAAKERRDAERAAMLLAAGRLRASWSLWREREPEYAWDGIPLSSAAARETSALVRAALVIVELWRRPAWNRKVKPEVAAALSGVDGAVGPWGDGDFGRLVRTMRATVVVAGPSPPDLLFEGAASDPVEPGESSEGAPDSGSNRSPIADDEVADPYTQERPSGQPPRIALSGLRDVAWSELEHAYGRAAGVPAMLDALSSPDPDDRRWGLDALIASINHQGSVYSASGPAARFLIELAGRSDVEQRPAILRLLAGLAVHDPSHCLFSDLERAASSAFAHVSEGAPTFLRLLEDPSAEVRASAAHVLSFVTPPEGAAAAVERALARETDRYARSSLLLALGYIGRRTRSTVHRAAIERWLDVDCPLLAGSAAIAVAQIDRDACSPRVRDLLKKTVEEAPPVSGAWPWNGGDAAGFARIVRLAILSVEALLDEADAASARGDAKSAGEYAVRALHLAFGDDVHGPLRPWVARELDDTQRRTLHTLVRFAVPETEWQPAQLPLSADAAYTVGLPSSNVPATMRLLREADGASETTVVVGEHGWPAWFVVGGMVDGRFDHDAALAALAALAPAQRVAVVEDLLEGPYALHVSRTRFDFSDPRAYERANDHASAYILALAAILDSAAAAGVRFARELAEAQLPLGDDRSAIRAVLAAVVLARDAAARGAELPAEMDALVAVDQAPATTYCRALKEVFRFFAPQRRARLLAALPLYEYQAHRDPRGEVRRWRNGRRWRLLELLEPAACAAEIIAALREWERHRDAGDDPHAEPVCGVSTSTQHRKPPPDEDFPSERAIELLARCGDAGRRAIGEALAAGDLADRALLEGALRQSHD